MSLAKINGVSVASIGKINGIAKASIGKFSGVELPSGEVNTTIANNTYFTPDHYYDFKGDANDQVGSAHGTVYGATYTESGIVDGCYSYDGNDYIGFNKSILYEKTTGFFVLYFTVTTFPSNDMKYVFGASSYNESYNYTFIRYDKNKKLQIIIPGGLSEPYININTNYQLIATWNGSSVKIILNGTPLDFISYSGAYTAQDILLGKGWNWQNHMGLIDDFFVGSEYLSDEAISWLYNDGNFRPGGYR